jgi:hypothetical protein
MFTFDCSLQRSAEVLETTLSGKINLWSQEEILALHDGIKKSGEGNWKKHSKFLS